MKPTIGRMYVGLTDDPVRRRKEHGRPADLKMRRFNNEAVARAWEAACHLRGALGGGGGSGWRYGYAYTITAYTTE